MKKVLKKYPKSFIGLGIVLLWLFVNFIQVYNMTPEEMMENWKYNVETYDLVDTEFAIDCVGCGNGTPKIYLRDNGEGFFQLMQGFTPSCRSDLKWSFDPYTGEVIVSGIYNSNCNLEQFNKSHSLTF